MYLRLAYGILRGNRDELIAEAKFPPRGLLECVLHEHEEVALNLVGKQYTEGLGLSVPAEALDVKHLVLGVLEVQLLYVAEVGTHTLEWLSNLLVDQVHHPRCQCLQGNHLELMLLLRGHFC